MTSRADPDQLASSEANWSGSTLFAKTGHVVFSKRRVKMIDQYCTVPDETNACMKWMAMVTRLQLTGAVACSHCLAWYKPCNSEDPGNQSVNLKRITMFTVNNKTLWLQTMLFLHFKSILLSVLRSQIRACTVCKGSVCPHIYGRRSIQMLFYLRIYSALSSLFLLYQRRL